MMTWKAALASAPQHYRYNIQNTAQNSFDSYKS